MPQNAWNPPRMCLFGVSSRNCHPIPTSPKISNILHYKSRFSLKTRINLGVRAQKIRSQRGNSLSINWVQLIYKPCSQCWTEVHVSSCESENTTTSHQHYATIYHLHWLPIRQRIMYKLSTIVYKCIHGAAPSYLTDVCVPVATNTSRQSLLSNTRRPVCA